MIKLFGIGNPGFSFTHTYLSNIVNLIDKVEMLHNKRDINYHNFQTLLRDPSRIRMIVPFLRDIGIISDVNFQHKTSYIDFRNFFTDDAQPFIKFIKVYKAIDLNNVQLCTKVMEVFRHVMNFYFPILCKNRPEYSLIYSYLQKFKYLDKYEFFVITSFEFNNVIALEHYTNADSWIQSYRNSKVNVSNYEFAANINCYSYIMQILCDFNKCIKIKDRFKLIDYEV